MTGTFDGKTAIVTGAGSGIGAAIATELATKGANVVATDINSDAATSIATAIEVAGGTAAAFAQDTADPAQSEAAVAFALERFGALHLAVNNAGIAAKNQLPTGELDLTADWERVININLNGVLYGLRYQLPAIVAAGGGAVVNVASMHAFVAAPNNSAYVASKHAIAGLTKNAAVEYGTKGVRINAIAPGNIWTPLMAQLPQDQIDAITAKHPIGRIGTAEEVAHFVSFLLSDEASFVTGSIHKIDGGYTAQ